ncbi:hypothetical protein [Streptomyces sp. NPDC004728]|uniref:hypothetical protein n=1 Tax=Streptomyces sp. NPDC004728 TaxID=3154289 RepID=UPI0033AB68FE
MQKKNSDVERLVRSARLARIALNVFVVLLVSAILALVIGFAVQGNGAPASEALTAAGDWFVKIAGVLLTAFGMIYIIYATYPPEK